MRLVRVMIFLLALCLCAGSAMAATEGDYSFLIQGNGVLITGYTGTEKSVIIPSELGGYPVTEIYTEAFYENDALLSVFIPEGVTSIGWRAFSDCENLESIYLPNSVTNIDYCAFGGCTSLTSVDLPDNLTCIEDSVFNGCTKLVAIDFPKELTSIDYQAFYECESLISVDIPDSVVSIDHYAFQGCSKLMSVELPNELEMVGQQVFYQCKSLTSLVLPENIETIGLHAFGWSTIELYCNIESITAKALNVENDYRFVDNNYPDWEWCYNGGMLCVAGYRGTNSTITLPIEASGVNDASFEGNTSIVSVNIPYGYTTIGSTAFNGCENLRNISIPDSVENIDGYAFYDCRKLLSVSIPEGVKSIGEWTFNGCSSLSTIRIPSGVTSIGDYAFLDCDSLTSIIFSEGLINIGNSAFGGCKNLRSLSLPSSLKKIDSYAFCGCDSITSITIPFGITEISSQMMESCDRLTSIVLSSNITSIDDTALPDNLRTVYTYKNSYAAKWAKENGKTVVYLDNADIEDYMAITGPRTAEFDAGDVYQWKNNYSLAPMPFEGSYTMEIASSDNSVAVADGDVVRFLKRGNVTLTVTVKELDWLSWPVKVTVFNPVQSFDLPTAVFSKVGADSFTIMPQNIQPAYTNPKYDWVRRGDYRDEDEDSEDFRVYVEDEISVSQLTVTAKSGVMRNCLLVTYEEAGMTRFKAFPASICPGMTVTPSVIAYVDNVPYVSELALYTLTSSNTKVAKPTADGKLLALKAGTATITAKNTLTGETVKQTITVSNEKIYTLPESAVMVSREAFAACPATIIVIPDGCETIAERAFADCVSLKRVEIPASVMTIADDAFSGCPEDMVIVAPEGSFAAEYASMHGFAE